MKTNNLGNSSSSILNCHGKSKTTNHGSNDNGAVKGNEDVELRAENLQSTIIRGSNHLADTQTKPVPMAIYTYKLNSRKNITLMEFQSEAILNAQDFNKNARQILGNDVFQILRNRIKNDCSCDPLFRKEKDEIKKISNKSNPAQIASNIAPRREGYNNKFLYCSDDIDKDQFDQTNAINIDFWHQSILEKNFHNRERNIEISDDFTFSEKRYYNVGLDEGVGFLAGDIDIISTSGLCGCVAVMVESRVDNKKGYFLAHVFSGHQGKPDEIQGELRNINEAIVRLMGREIEWKDFGVEDDALHKITLVRNGRGEDQRLFSDLRDELNKQGARIFEAVASNVYFEIYSDKCLYMNRQRVQQEKGILITNAKVRYGSQE